MYYPDAISLGQVKKCKKSAETFINYQRRIERLNRVNYPREISAYIGVMMSGIYQKLSVMIFNKFISIYDAPFILFKLQLIHA